MKGTLAFVGVVSGCCFIGLVAMLLTVFTKEDITGGYRSVVDGIKRPLSISLSVKNSISHRNSDKIVSLRETENVLKLRTKKGIRYNEPETQGLVTQDEFQFVNLVTPNPNIEITIEVVDDVEDHLEWPEPPHENNDDRILQPTLPPGQGDRRENSRVDSVDPLYNSSDVNSPGGYTWLSILRQRELIRDDDPPDLMGTSQWEAWTACSVSCGGGKKERSRSCGFSCTETETQECNRFLCPPEKPTVVPPRVTASSSDETPISSTDALKILDSNYLQTDDCNEWMSCRSEKLMSYLARLNDLPSCPCLRPSNLDQHNAIFDQQKEQLFNWVNMAVDDDWLDIYKPTAKNCIQSLLSPQSTSLAAQQCCYDNAHRLITRGSGAGTPHLISTEISPELNYKIDILPWIICKGDWTRYNLVRPPNNVLGCQENPDNEKYRQQWMKAKNF
ncbi:Isthmin-1 [Holothuria leucospilota]|uniref:Isthmin-1 n=1 Tax=Holothuria leucospilota TaxID=206669 RepID=A0A9Q1CHT3_HOLLE|nr:Isthmin-1 [Holothuria leucospilota]